MRADKVKFLDRRLKSGWEKKSCISIMRLYARIVFCHPDLRRNRDFLFLPVLEEKIMNNKNKKKFFNIRYITTTGILGALASVLMMISFSVPFMPSFIKLDFSELPALIASFSMGPVYGVAVCLIKNLVHLPFPTTGGIGELSNFFLGCFSFLICF